MTVEQIFEICRRGPGIPRSVKKCALFHAAENLRAPKKIFSDPGIPQSRKILKIRNFLKSSEKCLKSILGPKWGVLGEKWRFGARLK